MFGWVATAHACRHSTSNACTSLGRHCNKTHPSPSSSYGSVHPHFDCNLHASVRASGIEKERSCPTARATSPLLVDCAKLECPPKLGSAMSRPLWTSAGFNGSTSSCPHSKQENRWRTSGISITLHPKEGRGKQGKVKSGQVKWWSPLLLFGVAAFTALSLWLPPPLGGVAFSPSRFGWCCFSSSPLVGGAASLPLLLVVLLFPLLLLFSCCFFGVEGSSTTQRRERKTARPKGGG